MGRLRVLLWPAGAAVGLLAERTLYGFGDPGSWLPDLATGWSLIGAGLIVWRRRPESRVGWLLTLSGFAWFVGNFVGVDAAWLAWIASHGLYVHRGPLMHAVLAFPTGRARQRVELATIGVLYVAAFVTPVWGSESLAIALSTLLAAIGVRSYVTAVAGERRARRTAMWAAVALGAVLAGGAVARLVAPGDPSEELSARSYQATLCAIAIGLAFGLLSRPWDQIVVADLVVELGQARTDALRSSLARALDDPNLEVGYWSPDDAGFVDADGRGLVLPGSADGRVATVVEGGDQPLAVIVHDRSLLDDPALVEAVGTATRLASVNARQQAQVEAQVAELDASRRRLVTAGDEEHRRLEARLRAGAEHRLAVLASRIGEARAVASDRETDELLAELETRIVETLEELRTLAAGLHPRLLGEIGLAGALEALAARCPAPVRVVVADQPVPATVEVAAYFVCSEALANVAKHAEATHVAITVEVLSDRVTVEVRDDGVGGAEPGAGSGLRNLIDRVEALGGTLEVLSSPAAGTRLVAELPVTDDVP